MKEIDRDLVISGAGYALSRIIGKDKELYVELQRQVVGESSLILNQHSHDIMWRSALDNKRLYAILDDSMIFCGTIELIDESRTPEIGIALLEKHRNHGIAKIAVKMLMELTYTPTVIDYYIIRIKKSNTHSIHVFEKLGAELIGEERSAKEKLRELMTEENWNVCKQSELLGIFENGSDEDTVLIYRLSPVNSITPEEVKSIMAEVEESPALLAIAEGMRKDGIEDWEIAEFLRFW